MLSNKLADIGRIKVLALDGAGMYGLSSAIWLRQIAELNEDFLKPPDRDVEDLVFAGISSGAVNCLLLAAAANPRKALLDGKLERFWKEPDVFANHDPLSYYLSFWGLTPWFGSDSLLQVLRRYLGDITLGNLKHEVVISTFNWSGGSISFDSDKEIHNAFGAPMSFAGNADQQFWRPKIFNNFRDKQEPDLQCRAIDVAYAAASPQSLRTIRGGVGDAAVITANPSLATLGELLRKRHHDQECETSTEGDGWNPERFFARDQDILSKIHILSLGSGASSPFYFSKNIPYGPFPFSILPSNILLGNIWPPHMQVGLDASAEDTNIITQELLGNHTFRLNPRVLSIPILVATMMSREPSFQHWISQYVEATMRQSEVVKRDVEAAADFVRNDWEYKTS